MNFQLFRIRLLPAFALLLVLASIAVASSDQSPVNAALEPASSRKSAPEFALQDSSGKTASLKDYRGKVVLLDFWATWCHGCKEEIPWFVDFHHKYEAKGLAVVGVSLDSDGWKVVKPFVAEKKVPYRILLGDDATAQKFGVEAMPDTYLIDRQGRIAATYKGLVDKNNVEANLRALLARP